MTCPFLRETRPMKEFTFIIGSSTRIRERWLEYRTFSAEFAEVIETPIGEDTCNAPVSARNAVRNCRRYLRLALRLPAVSSSMVRGYVLRASSKRVLSTLGQNVSGPVSPAFVGPSNGRYQPAF